MINKEKIEDLSVKVLTDITEALDKTDAVLKLTLANIAAEIAIICVEVNK